MKAPQNPPDLAQELVRIHKVITRGLTVGVAKGEEFHQQGFPNPRTRQGYTDYAQSLAVVLRAHHLAEDEIGFPAFREMFPHAPFERLSANHREMETLLHPLGKAIANVARVGGEADLTQLVDLLRSLSAIWTPHIQVEEDDFSSEAVNAVMSSEEQGRLSAALVKHNQEHSSPASLILPFLMFNLNAEDRAIMAASVPGLVTKVVVPLVWKSRWAPMKPFLLD
jgi:hypothetical protein